MNKKMLKPSILSISLLTIMASAAVSPALSEISQAFSNIDKTMIRLILTIPSLVVIPSSLLSGWLAARMKKKHILYIGLAIYLIAGIGGGLAQDITQMLIIRGFLGIGIGFILPLANTLIVDFFEGPARNKMMGLAGAANQIGSIILLSVSGYLAAISWRYSFGVYGLALVSLIFIIFWLPEPPKKVMVKKEGVKLTKGVFFLAGLACLMMIAFYVVATDLALFIEKERPVFSSGKSTVLFKNKEDFKKHLALGKISDTTIEGFKENGIDLSEKAILSETIPGERWHITDGLRKYAVVKEKENNEPKLTIYAGYGTSVVSAWALGLMTLSGAIAGFCLSIAMKVLKKFIIPFSAILMGIGYGILSISNSIWMILFGMIFIGMAGGFMSPPLMLSVPRLVAPNARALAMAIVSSSLFFGQFLSPLVMKAAETVSGHESSRFRFAFLCGCLLLASLIGIFKNVFELKKDKIKK